MLKTKKASTNNVNRTKTTLFFVLIIASFFLLIPFGAISNTSQYENSASFITDFTLNNTNDGEYSCAIIDNKNNKQELNSAYAKYYYWYDVFNINSQPSRNAFFGMVNADKSNTAHFVDFDSDKTISFLYTEYNSNVQYKNHWKHEYYHIELMFKGDFSYEKKNCYSFCYLTETQAKKYMNNSNPTKEDYLNILGNTIDIAMGDKVLSWYICDIILETNNVYDCLTKLFDNWIMGYNKYPKSFSMQHVYVFNKYNYQNYFKIKYINHNYLNKGNYNIGFGTTNIKNQSLIDNNVLAIKENNVIWLQIIIIVCFLTIQVLAFVFFNGCLNSSKKFLLSVGILFIPFLILKILFFVTNNVFLFSYPTLISFAVAIILDIVVVSIFYFARRQKCI